MARRVTLLLSLRWPACRPACACAAAASLHARASQLLSPLLQQPCVSHQALCQLLVPALVRQLARDGLVAHAAQRAVAGGHSDVRGPVDIKQLQQQVGAHSARCHARRRLGVQQRLGLGVAPVLGPAGLAEARLQVPPCVAQQVLRALLVARRQEAHQLLQRLRARHHHGERQHLPLAVVLLVVAWHVGERSLQRLGHLLLGLGAAGHLGQVLEARRVARLQQQLQPQQRRVEAGVLCLEAISRPDQVLDLARLALGRQLLQVGDSPLERARII